MARANGAHDEGPGARAPSFADDKVDLFEDVKKGLAGGAARVARCGRERTATEHPQGRPSRKAVAGSG